jgi:hypothetical protein
MKTTETKGKVKSRYALLEEILKKHYLSYRCKYFSMYDIRVVNKRICFFVIYHTRRKWGDLAFLESIGKYFNFTHLKIKSIQFHSHEVLIKKRDKT